MLANSVPILMTWIAFASVPIQLCQPIYQFAQVLPYICMISKIRERGKCLTNISVPHGWDLCFSEHFPYLAFFGRTWSGIIWDYWVTSICGYPKETALTRPIKATFNFLTLFTQGLWAWEVIWIIKKCFAIQSAVQYLNTEYCSLCRRVEVNVCRKVGSSMKRN